MSPSAHVQSVQAIDDLKKATSRFEVETREVLRAAEQEIRRVEEWLQERLAHWRLQVQRRQEELRRAEAALARCRASGYRDPKTGAYHTPSCTAEQLAVSQARTRLQEGEAELQNVQHWMRMVSQAATSYRAQSQRLGRVLSGDLPKANAFLGAKVTELQAYLMAGPSVGTGATPPASPSRATTTAPPTAGGWVDTGIQTVSLDQIDLSDSPVTGTGDFQKVSAQEVTEGFRKLQDVVAPAVAQGADGDYFSQLDAAQGLDYAHGYRRIYDAFYGQGAIRLDKVGDRYQVVNGYHRLFIARQLGIKTIPARVIAPQS